jgi:AcrR family transcriptional regulator
MAPIDIDSASFSDVTAVAIHLLAERGYDSTSVDELADALNVSRSTFFRRFGTKEDIVFADHAYLLSRLNDVMTTPNGDAFESVNRACLSVLSYHISRPEATLERRALLRSNPSLRERELVMSHRYERIFRSYLAANVSTDETQTWVPSAYAAAAVAVHNDALRTWFTDESIDSARLLQRELADLTEAFRRHCSPRTASRWKVVVTAYDDAESTEIVLARIRTALDDPTP